MESVPIADLKERLRRAQEAAAKNNLAAFLLSPGPDLRYFVDYEAKALERITCLMIPSKGDPVLVVPRLEKLPAQMSGAGLLGIEILTYGEFDDPYQLIAKNITNHGSIAVDDRMWAVKAHAIKYATPNVTQVTAGKFVNALRSVKSRFEIDALRAVAQSIDSVHKLVPHLLKVGRTELDVARDIGALILKHDHAKVDFIIVASGPNGASPHHEPGSRKIQADDAIVVDIGGTSHLGYCSDSTRMYAMSSVSSEFLEMYQVLQEAQDRAVKVIKPGVKPSEIDHECRSTLADADLGHYFIHRTGHGIGVETHEDPYIGSSLHEPILENQAFSVEPGFYIEGKFGARIEDIVACTSVGVERLNTLSRDLVIVPA